MSCLTTQHSDASEAQTCRSQVKHSITEPLGSLEASQWVPTTKVFMKMIPESTTTYMMYNIGLVKQNSGA